MPDNKGFKVNRKHCSTCIFTNRSPVSPERFKELEAIWERDNIVQECHHATIDGLQVGCFGHYNEAKQEKIPHPVPDLFKQIFNIEPERFDTHTIFTLCERMGLIHFVDIEDLPDEPE